MEKCVFCEIAEGKSKAEIIRQTDGIVVIKDIDPQADVHYLIIPKKHVKDITQVDDKLWKSMKDTALYIAREKGLRGFRLVHNAGDAAGIPHMQIHFLGITSPERSV